MHKNRLQQTLLICLAFVPLLNACFAGNKNVKDGDIIFQSLSAGQGKAIQIATHSKYSHCGIIFIKEGKPYVYEAVQPVKITPLDEWIARGDNEHYVIKRLRDAQKTLSPDVLANMKSEGEKYLGKDYDIYFAWNDDQLYCSELVWKIYKRGAGIEIGALKKLSSFDLKNPIVEQKLTERYGNNIPYDEMVISPQAIFENNNLVTVEEK
ncbi:MAG: YiiX family permuted papain-like enzyme [Bacteroidetes bacterium]|nr:YiiX family permuted papain-like enzyme [Bacteroidota bacterium]